MSDAYSANTALLIHMEGVNDSTIFTDTSFFSNTITRYDNAKISTAISKWGNGSGYFDGNGDYLAIPYNASLFDPNTTDFTVEMWIYCTQYNSSAGMHLIGTYSWASDGGSFNSGWHFALAQTTGYLGTGWGNNGNWIPIIGTTTAPPLNQWNHIALVKYGNQWTIYLNGTSVGTTNYSTPVTVTKNRLTIGGALNGGTLMYFYYGYINDLRITKGIARYTTNFTPPVARLSDPGPVTGVITSSVYPVDIYDGGIYRIVGIVMKSGVAGSYRVRLFDRQSARCIRETWSNQDGSYAFNNIAYCYRGYFVIAFDHGNSPLNAAIADLFTPKPMP